MAGKTDPSLYNERTSIGSSDDLDEYGVWVKTEPQDLSASLPDIEELPDFDSEFGEELPDLENITADELDLPDIESVSADELDLPDIESVSADELDLPDIESVSADELDLPDIESVSADELELPDIPGGEPLSGIVSLEPADIEFEEISEDMELPEGIAPTEIDADGFTEVSMDDFLEGSGKETPESIDFGDLDSSVSEMEAVDAGDDVVLSAPDSAPAPSGEARPFAGDRSTQLLQKIADELSSIKKEISGLKKELSVVRGEVKAQEDSEAAGFFDEEDDEKIALTGDELDNILNTAHFTEETGAGEESVSLFDEQADTASIEINFDEDMGELESAVSVEDELPSQASDDFDIELDLTPDFQADSVELDALREEGASPITEAPEDTSYLDEAIDLPEAAGGGPFINESGMEEPVGEPVIDNISIDLDMEEALPEISSADDFVFETEETLEIPAVELPEIPEIDDDISFIDSVKDEELPSVESVDDSFVEDLLPAVSEETDVSETGPRDFDEPEPARSAAPSGLDGGIPNNLKQELKTVLSYMDQLLESLPEDKIEEFAKSEYFETYKKLFEELGLV